MSATGTPAAMRADARRNRQRLISAALAAFTEHGADDASLDAIARRAGVGIGTLYRHFPTRQALLEAVYRDQVEELCSGAGRLGAAASPAQALESWLRALMAFSATKKNLTSSLMSGPDSKRSEVAVSCSAMVRETADKLLTEAQRSGEIRPDVDATDLLRLSHALAMSSELPSVHADQPERLMKVLLDGLRAGGTSPGGRPPGTPR
jgi:AcrR family transcriptional regulator